MDRAIVHARIAIGCIIVPRVLRGPCFGHSVLCLPENVRRACKTRMQVEEASARLKVVVEIRSPHAKTRLKSRCTVPPCRLSLARCERWTANRACSRFNDIPQSEAHFEAGSSRIEWTPCRIHSWSARDEHGPAMLTVLGAELVRRLDRDEKSSAGHDMEPQADHFVQFERWKLFTSSLCVRAGSHDRLIAGRRRPLC